MKPQIVFQNSNIEGYHNVNSNTISRLSKSKCYEDLSTICIIPTRGMIAAKVTQCWLNMILPMNQKFIRMFLIGMKVDDAYNSAIEYILSNPELSKWKYVLTLEDDNCPPPDAFIKLYEAINTPLPDSLHGYDAVSGLYYTKGEAGMPMIYGNPEEIPLSFRPQVPHPDTIQRCNGLGMGCTLFRLDMFKNTKLRKPWFKTKQEFISGKGVECYTQDLYFFTDAGSKGYKFAVDNKIRVGHYDIQNDFMW